MSDMTSYTNHQKRNIAGDVIRAQQIAQNNMSSIEFTKLDTSASNFAGMDSSQMPVFRKKVETFAANIEETINKLSTIPDITEAYQGEAVKESATELLNATRDLLKKYVEHIKLEATEVEDANRRWLESAGKMAGGVKAKADEIRSAASGIHLDD